MSIDGGGGYTKQRAHAWVALRALKLIDAGTMKNKDSLIELLLYYLSDVWESVWLPDTLIGDMNYGHIFKMDSDNRFVSNISSKEHRKDLILVSKMKLRENVSALMIISKTSVSWKIRIG